MITADVEDELPTPSVGKMLVRCISYIPLIYMYIGKRSGYNQQHECSNMIFVLRVFTTWIQSPYLPVQNLHFREFCCQVSHMVEIANWHLALIFWAQKPHAICLVHFVFQMMRGLMISLSARQMGLLTFNILSFPSLVLQESFHANVINQESRYTNVRNIIKM